MSSTTAKAASTLFRSVVRQSRGVGRRLSYQALASSELETAVETLDGWAVIAKDDAKTVLAKKFQFANFVEAWSFMSSVALQVCHCLCCVEL